MYHPETVYNEISLENEQDGISEILGINSHHLQPGVSYYVKTISRGKIKYIWISRHGIILLKNGYKCLQQFESKYEHSYFKSFEFQNLVTICIPEDSNEPQYDTRAESLMTTTDEFPEKKNCATISHIEFEPQKRIKSPIVISPKFFPQRINSSHLSPADSQIITVQKNFEKSIFKSMHQQKGIFNKKASIFSPKTDNTDPYSSSINLTSKTPSNSKNSTDSTSDFDEEDSNANDNEIYGHRNKFSINPKLIPSNPTIPSGSDRDLILPSSIASSHNLNESESFLLTSIFLKFKDGKNCIIDNSLYEQQSNSVILRACSCFLDFILNEDKYSGLAIIITNTQKVGDWISSLRANTNLRSIAFPLDEQERFSLKEHCIYSINSKGTIDTNNLVVDVLVIPSEKLETEKSFIERFTTISTIFDANGELLTSVTDKYRECEMISHHSHFNIAIENADFVPLLTSETIPFALKSKTYSLFHFVSPVNCPQFTQFENKYFLSNELDTLQSDIRKFIATEPFDPESDDKQGKSKEEPNELTIDNLDANNFDASSDEVEDEHLNQAFSPCLAEGQIATIHEYLISICMTNVQRNLHSDLLIDNLNIFLSSLSNENQTDHAMRKLGEDFELLASIPQLLKPFDSYLNYYYERFENHFSFSYETPDVQIPKGMKTAYNAFLISSGKINFLLYILVELLTSHKRIVIVVRSAEMATVLNNVFFMRDKLRSSPHKLYNNDNILFVMNESEIAAYINTVNSIVFFSIDFEEIHLPPTYVSNMSNDIDVYYLISQDSIESELFPLYYPYEKRSKELIWHETIQNTLYYALNGNRFDNSVFSKMTENIVRIYSNLSSIDLSYFHTIPPFENPKILSLGIIIPNLFNTIKTSFISNEEKALMNIMTENATQPPNTKIPKALNISNVLNISPEIFRYAASRLLAFGFLGQFLASRPFFIELTHVLYAIAYIRLSEEDKYKYRESVYKNLKCDPYLFVVSYPCQVIQEIFKTNDISQSNSFFEKVFGNKSAIDVMKIVKKQDELLTIAVYIANEPLPKNFQFAPSMSKPIGWTPNEDYIVFITMVMLGNAKSTLLFKDSRLPFDYLRPPFQITEDFIINRQEIIYNEMKLIVPNDYNIFSEPAGNTVKKFASLSTFKIQNQHIFNISIICKNDQKVLLRALYLYGIPADQDASKAIEKLKVISRLSYVNSNAIGVFVASIIEKCSVFNKSISDLHMAVLQLYGNNSKMSNLLGIPISTLRKSFDWIPERIIQPLLSNLILLGEIRKYFHSFNHVIQFDQAEIERWKIADDSWNADLDKVLFNITAYHGFLFFSDFPLFLTQKNINLDTIYTWRETEAKSLSPVPPIPQANHLRFMFPIEARKERLNYLIQFIKMKLRMNSR